MWGRDSAKVFTVEEGWVWAFSAVEHWHAKCVGWYVTKRGDRYAALAPDATNRSAGSGSSGALYQQRFIKDSSLFSKNWPKWTRRPRDIDCGTIGHTGT